MNKKIVYVAELDQDIDDYIASIYLHRKNVLDCIVLDPIPKTEEGKTRIDDLKNMGIRVETKFPSDTEYVFVGGALTSLSQFIQNHKIKVLCMNGGFVGCNIVEYPLKKFEGKRYCRTFNFNMDINATEIILKSKNIKDIMLIGKNVCHSIKNTKINIWKNESILNDFHAKDEKRMHDLLACYEGLVEYGFIKGEKYCLYKNLYPCNNGIKGIYTEWGASEVPTKYRICKMAVNYK